MRCQQTLQPLTADGDDALTSAEGLRYPKRHGLVFMGYPAHDAAVVAAMEEERVWQGTSATAARDLEFLRVAAPATVEIVNRIRARVDPAGARALDLGSGSGWGAWLLAAAGYETWMCDFEANSLALGTVYRHPNLRERVVADGRYPPFADGSFDVVLCKEFVHHVEDKHALCAEVNRVLKPGGVLAMSDPMMTLAKWLRELRRPDSHESHRISWPGAYWRALAANGFDVVESGYRFSGEGRWLRGIRRIVEARTSRRRQADPLTGVLARIPSGGTLRAIAIKRGEATRVARPALAMIPPERVRVDDSDRQRFVPLTAVLEESARGLASS